MVSPVVPHRGNLSSAPAARDWIAPVPDAALLTSGQHLPASARSASSTVPVLPKPVSNIARLTPSLLPRPPARRTIPIAIADGQGGAELAPLKLVLAFDVGHNHGQHLFVNVNSRYSVSHTLPPGRSEKRAATYINQGRGLSPLSQGKKRRPIIRSITHPPDHTNRRPHLIHCPFHPSPP